MKKKVLLRIVLTTAFIHGLLILLSAQETKRNLLQVKYTINYFRGYEPSFLYALFYPDVSYKRFFKNKQGFVEFEFDNLTIAYRKKHDQSDFGKVFRKDHYIFESKIGCYLMVTPRISIMAKTGFAFKYGEEVRIANLVYIAGTNTVLELLTETYRNHDFGLEASFEFLYRYSKRWSLTLSGGGQYFLTRRITTKQQLWVSPGIGYAF